MRAGIVFVLLLQWFQLAFSQRRRPNFIVMQPDDLKFFEEWSPPAHFPYSGRSEIATYRSYDLPNMRRLMNNGVRIEQAYTTSPMCGTSRYSTLTGRYPSRASSARRSDRGSDMVDVHIPSTKLLDIGVRDGNDCSQNNIAALLSRNGYNTGVVGKWHLLSPEQHYDYDNYRSRIRSCGFDYADGIYAENMNNFWHDGTFSHNMEYITMKAEQFLRSNARTSQPFFLYFNPTAPHDSGDMIDALTWFTCRDTPEGTLSRDPMVTGMTADYGNCDSYRRSIFQRANGSNDPNVLGSIWVDDAVGALFRILADIGELDNTFFLFQMDHGKEGKGSLYEPGVRVARFIHFPQAFGTTGYTWPGLMSTIDIAPTIAEYAGIDESSPGYYWMDGESVRSGLEFDLYTGYYLERCLVFELDYDRAVRCGCFKYMALDHFQSSRTMRKGRRMGVAVDNELFFNLCGSGVGRSVSAPGRSPEATDHKRRYPHMLAELRSVYADHVDDTRPY